MNPLVILDASTGLTRLSVNVNKIALLRNTRHLGIPSVTRAATLCLEAGADGITVHPRPDERHIRASDVHELAALMKHWPQAEYNIEGNPFHNLMSLVREIRPHQCTLVPDSEGQFTSDHGWDLEADADRLRPLIAEAHSFGVRVSLFMDPLPEAMPLARALGADRVELYTEPYAASHGSSNQATELGRFAAAARAAQAAGLGVNAGHDLNRDNLGDFLRAVPGVEEVSIGHALIADALELGLAETVRAFQRVIRTTLAPSVTATPDSRGIMSISGRPGDGR
jgi:pyridoxine 5-phosphate synthase